MTDLVTKAEREAAHDAYWKKHDSSWAPCVADAIDAALEAAAAARAPNCLEIDIRRLVAAYNEARIQQRPNATSSRRLVRELVDGFDRVCSYHFQRDRASALLAEIDGRKPSDDTSWHKCECGWDYNRRRTGSPTGFHIEKNT